MPDKSISLNIIRHGRTINTAKTCPYTVCLERDQIGSSIENTIKSVKQTFFDHKIQEIMMTNKRP